MALAGTSTRKRYTYPYKVGSMLSQAVPMATLPSQSVSQPGPPVVAPPAAPPRPSVGSAMTAGQYGGGALSFGAGATQPAAPAQTQGTDYGVADALAAAGIGPKYTQMPASTPSPYERYYWEDVAARRGIEAGREGQANELMEESRGWLSPQAWAHAGPDSSYWKGETARQLSVITQQYNDAVENIEWRYRTGQINAARRQGELDRLKRDLAGQKAAVQSAVQQQRMQTGLQAAQTTAQQYGQLMASVPRDYARVGEPAATPLQTLDTSISVGGLGQHRGGSGIDLNQIAKELRAAGYSTWKEVPEEIRKAYLGR